MPIRFSKFRRWSITTLMSITLLVACVFAYVHVTNPERKRERSRQASLKRHMEFNVPLSDMYVTRTTTTLPIRDECGGITTGSCGPHFNLTQQRYDKALLREVVPTIRRVMPRTACSHVAIYLNSEVYNDLRFVTELEASLPNIAVFDE